MLTAMLKRFFFFIAKVGHLIKIVAALLCTLTIVYIHHVTSDSLPNSPF